MELRSSNKRKNNNNEFLSSNKQRTVKNFTITDDEDFFEELPKILKKSKLGDIINYLTKNQLGVKTYEVVMDKNKKNINQIGDCYGLFSDPEHPDYYLYK